MKHIIHYPCGCTYEFVDGMPFARVCCCEYEDAEIVEGYETC